jgi:hypothetical protein
MEWLGGPFDPEEFDIDEVNHYLARLRRTGKPKRADVPEALHQAFEQEDK